jgi:hypothetical protein
VLLRSICICVEVSYDFLKSTSGFCFVFIRSVWGFSCEFLCGVAGVSLRLVQELEGHEDR